MSGAWPICGNCPTCLQRTNALLRVPARTATMPGPKPTAAALERHAQRFGPEQVAETATQYGLSVAIERPKARRKAGGPGLKARVATLVADGYGVDAIAEIEDLSPSRARRLVEEVTP